MSRIFYDHLIILEEVEVELENLKLSRDEKRELENLIEEIIHHRVIGRVLDHLPKVHHEEFLRRFTKVPHDPSLISYLDMCIEDSVEKHIADEVDKIKKEVLEDLKEQLKKKSK